MAMHGIIALVFVGILILVLTKPFSMPARQNAQIERGGRNQLLVQDDIRGELFRIPLNRVTRKMI